MQRIQVALIALGAVQVNSQMQKLPHHARAALRGFLKQMRAVVHVLRAQMVLTAKREPPSAPSATWARMRTSLLVCPAPLGCTPTRGAVPNVRIALPEKFPMRKPPRVKSPNGKSRRTASWANT